MRCFFGFHQWSPWFASLTCDTKDPYMARRCRRCRTIRVLWEGK